jgi:hypothetical protein
MPELAEPPFQLLHRLLNYSAAPLVQVLGTELFASLAEVSTEAEHALASLHQLVPELLKLSKTEPTPAAKASAAAAAAAAAANGSIPDAPAVDVQVGALHALEKYVSLCSRLRCSPPFLSEIQVGARQKLQTSSPIGEFPGVVWGSVSFRCMLISLKQMAEQMP